MWKSKRFKAVWIWSMHINKYASLMHTHFHKFKKYAGHPPTQYPLPTPTTNKWLTVGACAVLRATICALPRGVAASFIWHSGLFWHLAVWECACICVRAWICECAFATWWQFSLSLSLHRLLSKTDRDATSEIFLKINFMALLLY